MDQSIQVHVRDEAFQVRVADQIVVNHTTVNAGGGQTWPAAEALGGHRVVRLTADGQAAYAQQSDPVHCRSLLGLTTGAAAAGETVSPVALGDVSEPSWAWTPGAPVFLVGQGQLSQTPPPTGHLVVIGLAVAPTRLAVHLQPPVLQGV